MDRPSFLSSMPFLLPCPSATWPPRRNAASTTEEEQQQQPQPSTQMDVLLDNNTLQKSCHFNVSIEPAISASATSSSDDMDQALQDMQPAFFGPPAKDEGEDNRINNGNNIVSYSSSFDPAMTDILVAVESSAPNGGPLSGGRGGALEDNNLSQDDPSVMEARVLFSGRTQTPASSSTKKDKKIPNSISAPSAAAASLESWPLFLYFKIDGTVFQVDGKQLLHAKVVVQSSNGEESGAAGLPPCLMLVFSCCLFRIFPLNNNNNNNSASIRAEASSDSDATTMKDCYTDALEALKNLETVLGQLVACATASSATSMSAAWSPSSSAPTSSGEAGQKDGPPNPGTGDHHSTSSSTTTIAHGSQRKKSKSNHAIHQTEAAAALENNHLIRKIKRRRDALARSRAGLQAVETILDMPESVYSPDLTLTDVIIMPSFPGQPVAGATTQTVPMTESAISDIAMNNMPKTQGGLGHLHLTQANNGSGTADTQLTNNEPHESKKVVGSMVPLLQGITEDMANAYGTEGETQEALQLYQREIETLRENRVDDLLDAFFPTMPQRHGSSAKKKGRREKSSKAKPNRDAMQAQEPKDGISADKAKESVLHLMKQQRSLVQERSSLLQLPTRG